MKMFIYAAREFDEIGYAAEAAEKYGCEFGWTSQYPDLNTAELARGCEAISFTPCTFDSELVKKFSSLGVKYFTLRSIGFEHVDMDECKKQGIRVSNTTYTPNGVANYAIMLMLMCLRNMAHILKRSEVQDFSLKGKIGKDISACTVGIIGTGRIGATTIRHLSGFACKILAYDVFENEEVKKYAEYVSLDELLSQCDVISIHAPSNEETFHLINDESIAKMKNGVVLVNTARGTIIDTPALIRGIESSKIGAAALDVLENEDGLYYYNRANEVIVNHEMAILRSYPNVILAPHTAFYTDEDVQSMIEHNFESLYLFETGKENPLELKIK